MSEEQQRAGVTPPTAIITKHAAATGVGVVGGIGKKRGDGTSATRKASQESSSPALTTPRANGQGDVGATGSKKKGQTTGQKRQSAETKTEDVSYTLLRRSERTSDWDILLREPSAVAWVAPVNFFMHAPFASRWKEFAVSKIGCKIELPHPRSIGELPVYCVATIKAFAGYKVLVRFEGKSSDNYAWITYCCDIPKPLGFSFENNYIVLPVDGVAGEKHDVDLGEHSKFLDKIYGANPPPNSIGNDHGRFIRQKLINYQERSKLKLNDLVEVMDKEHPVKNRLSRIVAMIGDRIQVKYVDGPENDHGFCFNAQSELVHPLGWSHAVGQSLEGYPRNGVTLPTISKTKFPPVPPNVKIQIGMVFEVRHPIFPFKIATGAVKEKLKHGYFIAIIEVNDPPDSTEFVFHVTSQYILPCGFSSEHNIPLEYPRGEDDSFSWSHYMKENNVQPLIQENCYQRRAHSFIKGCKFEAVDLFEPLYLGPATVLNTAGHLLYIHFDGWPRSQMESYQWVSAFSCEIYPAGWAEMVGHRFQGHVEPPQPGDSFYIVNNNVNVEIPN